MTSWGTTATDRARRAGLTGRRLVATAALGGLALTASACTGSGDSGGGDDPASVLAGAKKQLDETSGVSIDLATDSLPKGVNGVLKAEGVGTHDPAFDGQITVATGSLSVDVPVVAVDGKVYAQLPFQTKFTPIDPAAYSAPDPADLMDPDDGLSSLLTAATGVTKGDQVRQGETVLTSYSGTLPGDAVAKILPSATPSKDFQAQFLLTDGGQLSEVSMTGAFYPKAPELTYTVDFTDYGTTKKISKP